MNTAKRETITINITGITLNHKGWRYITCLMLHHYLILSVIGYRSIVLITKKKSKVTFPYTLHGHVLEEVQSANSNHGSGPAKGSTMGDWEVP